jgi:3-hydroxybutyryl-CoA dehydratase
MAKQFDELEVGMQVSRKYVFSEERVHNFCELVDDFAPVHTDVEFAKKQGFPDKISHGFFVGSIFSGMMGMEIPGPLSVINSLNYKMHAPVPIGTEVEYSLKILNLSPSVKAVVLELLAQDQNGIKILSGNSMCSFPGS